MGAVYNCFEKQKILENEYLNYKTWWREEQEEGKEEKEEKETKETEINLESNRNQTEIKQRTKEM